MQLISIGKSSGNRIVINDPRISSYHAEILLGDDGSIFITDKGSTNGTTVRGQIIQAETEVNVNRGDKVTFAGVADLDWSKIPIVTPPPPQWKVYSIGGGLKNRIQINDASGRVSRYHATLKIDPKGQIFINDHSTNGTFVNDVRIQSGQDVRVKRKDKISFANAAPLDWKIVKPSGSSPWGIIAAALVILLIAGIGFLGMKSGWFGSKWSLEKTYNTYSNSIVCIYHEYRIVANLLNGDQLVLDVDNDGNYRSNYAIKGSDEAGKYTKAVSGTAFLVDKVGTLVTNRHITIPWESILKNKSLIGLQRINNTIVNSIEGETVYVGIVYNKTSISRISDFEECSILSRTTDTADKDIGLLRVKNQKQLPLNFTPIALDNALSDGKQLVVGQTIYLIGYPLGPNMFFLTSTGTTNTIEVKLTGQAGAISQLPDAYKFGHNAVSFAGSSGSPIFNDKGQLIGIHNSSLPGVGVQGYAWGILAKHAKELYDKE